MTPRPQISSVTLTWFCRSGYLTLSYVVDVVENYTLAEIPLETVVMDTEAWSNQEIFVLSEGYPPGSLPSLCGQTASQRPEMGRQNSQLQHALSTIPFKRQLQLTVAT